MPGVRKKKGAAKDTGQAVMEAEQVLALPLVPGTDSSDPIEPSSEISVPDMDVDDSDFEEAKIVPKGRKRQPKAVPDPVNPVPPPKKAKRGGKKKDPVEEGPSDDSGSLFDVVKGGKSSLQAVVDEWIESYKNDRDQALLELIQFFIQCSGCKGKISPYMYGNMEHAEIIRKMTEEFDEESGDYPLIMTGPMYKKFKMNYCELVQVLVRQCQYSIIYDQYMMDNVISLLTGLTDSQVRAFRHTSTLAAMKLMTALVDVALNLSINLDNTQRQYEAERQKNQSKRASERLELLMSKRQELEENQEEIRNMLTYIFKGVFVHRYRDTQPEIRGICMAEIGVWMKKYPNMFLDDAYLKYVGWTLYDKIGDVRLCCLRSLQPLYETEDLATKMELFTNRFKDRIVEMTLDKEYDVAVQAVKLVISVLKFNENVLSDKDCENVYELVYSSHRQVAQAAGEFLNQKLFQRDDEATKNLKSKKGKKRSPNTPLIRDLVQFFIESELHEHGAYLVDSLWDINEMIKDWECMTDLLLEEAGKGEEPLDDRQETSLIEIMVCCVKQAATGESPVGRGPNRKLTVKEVKQVSEEKTKLTEHFIVSLPQLLAKYLMDAEKVTNLLQIPQYFDLEIYTTSRQEKSLEALLRYLHEIVEKHTDMEVLEACSKVFESLCSEEFAIAGKCDVARSTLIDGLAVKFKEAMQDFFAEGEQPDDDDTFTLVASLKRIYAFYNCHNLSSWNLWDDLFHIVRTAEENNAIPEEVIRKSIAACSMAVLWDLQKVDREASPDKNEVLLLKKRLVQLVQNCKELLYHPVNRVVEEAYITICDLLVVFSKQVGETNPLIKCLVFETDKNLQGQLSGFLTDKVFVDEDDDDLDENVKIEELHKKRNFLASFCKLIVYNIVHIRTAAEMFKHYMRFYNDYGDIIKATLSKAREINKVATAKTLVLSLTQMFQSVQQKQEPVDRSSDTFQSIKELARRFALSFGLDQMKNREAVAALHKEGIIFSLTGQENPPTSDNPPPNLPFLEILSEFTNKLMKQDKKTVVNYLDKSLSGGIPSNRSEDWQPLLTYRNSLVQGEAEIHPITLRPAIPAKPVSRGMKRKQPEVHEDNQWGSKDGARGGMVGQPQISKQRRLEDEQSISSEQGSEKDFEEQSIAMSQMSQMSWLASQRQQRELQRRSEVNYSRQSRLGNLPPTEELSEPSISEFTSPDLGHPSHQQHLPGGLFEEHHATDDSARTMERVAYVSQAQMATHMSPMTRAPMTPMAQGPMTPVPNQTQMSPMNQAPMTPMNAGRMTPMSQPAMTPVNQSPMTPINQGPMTPINHSPMTPLSHGPMTPLTPMSQAQMNALPQMNRMGPMNPVGQMNYHVQ